MAIKAQAPIVPVAVQGGRAAMHKGSMAARLGLGSMSAAPHVLPNSRNGQRMIFF